MESITDWLGHTTRLEYDADSNQNAIRFPAAMGIVDSATHDAAGQVASMAIGELASLTLTRNSAGQVTDAQWQGLPGTSQTYGYDAQGRLNDVASAEYAYDASGNPTKLGATDALSYDAAGQLIRASTPGGVVEYDHDAVGNRTAATPAGGPATAYEYDQARQLTSVDRDGDPAIAYEYDSAGLRTSRTKGGITVRSTWDSTGAAPLLLAEGQTSYVYDAEGLPLERIDGDGDVLFFHHDQLGSTRMLTDEEGAVVGTFTYDPYGNPAGATGSVTTPFGFAGEYTDADTDLVYLRARC